MKTLFSSIQTRKRTRLTASAHNYTRQRLNENHGFTNDNSVWEVMTNTFYANFAVYRYIVWRYNSCEFLGLLDLWYHTRLTNCVIRIQTINIFSYCLNKQEIINSTIRYTVPYRTVKVAYRTVSKKKTVNSGSTISTSISGNLSMVRNMRPSTTYQQFHSQVMLMLLLAL